MVTQSRDSTEPAEAPRWGSLASALCLGILAGAFMASAGFAWVQSGKKASSDSVITLKLGHVLDKQHPVHAAMEFMADRLLDLSGGDVVMEVFPNAQLGSETDCIEQVQKGALAMVKTSTASMEGFLPQMSLFGLPYLFRDGEHYWKVLDGPVGQELLLIGISTGVRGICYYDSGSRSFYTAKRPILHPEDLAGQKIRVHRSKMAMDMISLMGGAPTPIPWGELYTALQQGMVDGAENNTPSFFTSRHFEVARHYALDEHTRIPDLILFSESVWQSLPRHVQVWIEEAAQDSVVFQRKLWAEQTETNLQQLRDAGVEVYYPDKDPFREIVLPLYAPFEGTPTGNYITRIQSVQ